MSGSSPNRITIHFFYVSLILISIIILLATFQWTELPKFTEYLSTAATITSLVLALLAIIYAYISNDSLSRTTGIVTEAANAAQNATGHMGTLVHTLDTVAASTEQSNKRLDNILVELQREIESLNKTVDVLDGHSQAVATVLPDIPKELDKLGQRIDGFSQAASSKPEKNEKEFSNIDSDELSELAMKHASPSGLLLMYSCYLVNKSGGNINIAEIAKDFTTNDYVYGYLVALHSVELIVFSSIDDNSLEYSISACPTRFSEARDAFIKETRNRNSDAPDAIKSWLAKLSAIETLYLT